MIFKTKQVKVSVLHTNFNLQERTDANFLDQDSKTERSQDFAFVSLLMARRKISLELGVSCKSFFDSNNL